MENTVTDVAAPVVKKKAGAVKCIVWDLDETLWHGILSEHDTLRLRDGIADLLKLLDQRGIINTIASKNNAADALARLEAFGLLEYFLVPQISWSVKSHSIQKIKEYLNIGFDSIVFIDDQVFEREEVGTTLTDIRCFDVDIIAGMENNPLFIPRFITDETSRRRLMYLTDELRKKEEEVFTDNQVFLQQLQLQFAITPAKEQDLQRVEELTIRTNQLNATGYTYSYEELLAFIQSTQDHILVCELTDKYGSYGKIGVSMVSEENDSWNIKLLLMSCRVMSRGVGSVVLAYIIRQAVAHNKPLYADFFPTSRNRIMYIAYKFAGFKEDGKMENGGIRLKHDGTTLPAIPAYLQFDAAGL